METINITEKVESKQELEEVIQNYDECLKAQETICRSRLIPKNMKQQETFKELGFKFYEYSPIEDMYSAILPEGWNLVPTQNVLWTKILDDNDLTRGLIYYNPVKGTSSVSLRARYGIHTERTETETPNGLVVEKRVYFGDEENMLHIAGYVGANMNDENAEEILAQEELFIPIAEAYAEKHYPHYDDVTLYWGVPKSKQYYR